MTAERSRFRGVGPALVTPMRSDGSIDLAAFADHVRFCVDGGVHFVVPCGTTGESATMDGAEQLAVIERCIEAAGEVPVMAGAGTNSTRDACARARAAAEAWAGAILSVSPYYNKPTQEGLYRHYMEVADAAGIPVFVYNVPGRTGGNVAPSTLFRLAEAHEGIAGVKEASGDLQQVMTILRDRPEGFLVLSGEDHLSYATMALGGEGLISVVANEVPAQMSEMADAAMTGDWELARQIHYRLLPLMRVNFIETNPIPVKTALELMGRGKAWFRLPLCELSESHLETLREALELAGVPVNLGSSGAALAEAGR
jgi:4-hydroxy-tetrahydrodipicolinate synthase